MTNDTLFPMDDFTVSTTPKKASGSKKVFALLGASNHTEHEREEYDLYCTHPKAVTELLSLETFSRSIWEPCDGLGHISLTLINMGFDVRRSDIVIRKEQIELIDFLSYAGDKWTGDIITNPPYAKAAPFVRKAMEVIEDGCKVAMWLRILFLESKERKELFTGFPPKKVWISSTRIPCGMGGDFSGSSAQGYAWYIWEKGYTGETSLGWF